MTAVRQQSTMGEPDEAKKPYRRICLPSWRLSPRQPRSIGAPENVAPLCGETRCLGNPLMKRFQPRGRGANLCQRGEGSCLQLGCSEIIFFTMKATTFHEDVLYRGRGQRPNKRWQGGGACPVRTAHGSSRDRSFHRAPRAKSFGSGLILVLLKLMRAPLRRNAFFFF